MEKMENSICLDTDILVGLIRNKKEVVDWIIDNEEKSVFATTLINIFELFHGVYASDSPEKKVKDVKDIINRLMILNLSIKSVHEAGRQLAKLKKQGNIVDYRDMLIGTLALSEGFSLKTNNKNHFKRIKGLQVI